MKNLSARLTSLLHALTGHTAFALCYLLACVLFYPLRATANRLFQYLLFPWATALAYPVLTRRVRADQPGQTVLLVFFLWFLFSCYINRAYSFFGSSHLWLTHVAVLFALFPQPADRSAHAVLWEAELTAHLLAVLLLPVYLCGIYASFMQSPVDIGVGIAIGMIGEQRLHLFAHPNTVGYVALISLLLSCYVIIRRRGILRAAHVLNVCVLFLGIGLTQSRTSSIALSVAVALIAFCALHGRMKRMLPAAAAALLTAALCLTLQQVTWPALASLSNYLHASAEASTSSDTAVLPPADDPAADPLPDAPDAPTDQMIDIETRPLNYYFSTFSGRTVLWSGALSFLADHPIKLITGVSQVGVQETLIPYCPEIAVLGDTHSTYVQQLVSVGLPGLLLVVVFLLCQVKPIVQVLRIPSRDALRGAYVLPTIPIALAIISLMETILFNDNSFAYPVFSLALGWTAHLARTHA